MPESPDADELARARFRGKRYTMAAFVTFAAVFVGWSAVQVIRGVFGLGVPALAARGARGGQLEGADRPVPLQGDCARGLARLSGAVDRGVARASPARDEAEAATAFRLALSPEWDGAADVEGLCSAQPQGRDAYAALMRFRRAGEGYARMQGVELAPLRREVAEYLPP